MRPDPPTGGYPLSRFFFVLTTAPIAWGTPPVIPRNDFVRNNQKGMTGFPCGGRPQPYPFSQGEGQSRRP
jgi:hypothetical protein